jgi:amino acid permease
MSSDEFELLSREELLSGRLPSGRRASTLLFAIESRTAQLVAQSQQATALYLTVKAVEERERAFLEALAAGRDLPLQPTIQDLERYAPHWTPLVSEADASLRAALARALGQKYVFTHEAVPGIRTALGLDGEAVQQEYQRLYKEPLSSIYAPEITFRDRVRWLLSGLADRLEGLPPFWVAFALTLPVGPGLLALPIAVADVGPLAGIVLLIIFGLINALTAAALAETVARSGTTRFGLGYLGQLVSEYLGDAGSVLLTLVLALNNFLVLIVFYIGIAGTLEGATGLPTELWILGLFGVGLTFLSRKSLNSTVASTLVVTAINVTLLVIIPLFALPYVQPANLAYVQVPFVGGQPFDPSVLRLVFGVMLTNYFSHMLVANYGRVIIRRDPSARSWIWGSMASIGMTTLISCLWVVTFNGALSPEVLASETGTALTALAAQVGPAVNWLGSVFVILSLGMACIHISLGLLFLMEERLPTPSEGRLGARGRFLLSISPVVAVFLVAEWLSITGEGSFAGLLGYVGVISLPLLGGIFPVLLLAATRRKGDFAPGLVLRPLGNPVVLGGTYLVFLGSIFVYGLFIYEGAVEWVVTLLVGSVVSVVTVIMLRRGALDTRVVVELRQDLTPNGQHVFNVTANGQPAVTDVWLGYGDGEQHVQAATGEIPTFASLRYATFQLPDTEARELKVWTHKITPEENSQSLPALLEVHCGDEKREFDLQLSGGQIVLPLKGAACRLTITLPESSGTTTNLE